jgi:hypothetical protein
VFTIETPSEFDVGLRVKAHMEAIDAALSLLAANRPSADVRARALVAPGRPKNAISARALLPSSAPAQNEENRSDQSRSV